MFAAAREGPGKGEPETPPFRIGLADIVPLCGNRILLGKLVQYDLTGGVLGVALDGIDANLALPPGAVAKHQPDADELVLGQHPAVGQRHSEGSPFNLDITHSTLRGRC